MVIGFDRVAWHAANPEPEAEVWVASYEQTPATVRGDRCNR
jgi:hypothetical protein